MATTQAYKPSNDDIDKFLAEVESALTQVNALAKSESQTLRKDDLKEDKELDDQEKMKEDQKEQDMDMPMDEQQMDDQKQDLDQQADADKDLEAEKLADDAKQADDMKQADDVKMQDEEELAPLSDEELDQVYGSMDKEELLRHYMAMRRYLKLLADQDDLSDQEDQKMDEEETGMDLLDQAMDQKERQEDMEKSEKIAALEKKLEETNKTIQTMAKAFELIISKPQRKAITSLEYVKKSSSSETELLTDDAIKEKLKKFKPEQLSKSEREMVNQYLIYGDHKDEIIKLIESKGGR